MIDLIEYDNEYYIIFKGIYNQHISTRFYLEVELIEKNNVNHIKYLKIRSENQYIVKIVFIRNREYRIRCNYHENNCMINITYVNCLNLK
jgi:hypothetical protein